MKDVIKIFVGLLSFLLFFALIILATIRFELLNKSFLFNNLEKHAIYTKLPVVLIESLSNDSNFSKKEKLQYSEFIKNVPPQIVKPLVEDNLSQILDYLNGQSKDIIISFSLQGVGFQDASGFRWSLSETSDKVLQEKINTLKGISSTLTVAIGIDLAILLMLYVFSGKIIIFSGGISTIAVSLISKYFLATFNHELMKAPTFSQKLIGLMSSTLFSDIVTTWLIMGVILILLWLALHIKTKV